MRKLPVECALDCRVALGEGAIWSVREQALFFVDIVGGALWRFDPETGATQTWDMGRTIGCFALKGGGAVVALEDGFFDFDFASEALTAIAGPSPIERGHRFNDGSVDPRGRFYAGTMEKAPSGERKTDGVLYRLDPDHNVATVRDGYYVINGMAFSPDGRTAYMSDSWPPRQTIWAYDYDVDDATWRNERVFFDSRAVAGRPDGGAVDADGCYWMAGVGGWELVRLTPDGKVDMEIELPVEKPTRPAFGGKNLDTIFVTSLGEVVTEGTEARQPQAGSVFAVKVPGVQGVAFPEFGTN